MNLRMKLFNLNNTPKFSFRVCSNSASVKHKPEVNKHSRINLSHIWRLINYIRALLNTHKVEVLSSYFIKNIAVNLKMREEKVVLHLGFLTDRALDLGVKGQKFKKCIAISVKLWSAFKYKKYFPYMCRQDAPEKGITLTALRWQAEPQILKLCHWIKAMRLGYRDDKDMQKMLRG